jgi:hypothetical protein
VGGQLGDAALAGGKGLEAGEQHAARPGAAAPGGEPPPRHQRRLHRLCGAPQDSNGKLPATTAVRAAVCRTMAVRADTVPGLGARGW